MFNATRSQGFASLYMACSLARVPDHLDAYYIATLAAGPLRVSLYKLNWSQGILAVYHVGSRVLWCGWARAGGVEHGERAPQGLGRGVTGRYAYTVHSMRLPRPPASTLTPALAKWAERLIDSVSILEYRVNASLVYDLGLLGSYRVYLAGYAWVKAERNGSREVLGAAEHGSRGEPAGAARLLFSTCRSNAWAEHNRFAALFKAEWSLASNTCLAVARHRGRPALLLRIDGSVELSPGGPTSSYGPGCFCR